MYFHICMLDYSSGSVVLDPRATNHACRCMMAEESNCTTQYEMNAHENTTRPNSIMDDPECRRLGNWDMFRHSEYGTYLVSRARANSYPEHNAICMTCMNATKIQPNMHNVMKWHTRCTMQHGIHNALIYNLAYTMLWNEMAYAMHNGLTLTWVDLSRTHTRGHQDENETTRDACTRARKPRTDPKAPNATLTRHGKTWNMAYYHANFRGKMRCKTAPKHGKMVPDAWNESRNVNFGAWNGL